MGAKKPQAEMKAPWPALIAGLAIALATPAAQGVVSIDIGHVQACIGFQGTVAVTIRIAGNEEVPRRQNDSVRVKTV